MLRVLFSFFLLLAPLFAGSLAKRPPASNPYELREGDIVFQDTGGPQGRAVRDATGSRFTHCGVVAEFEGRLVVLEAVQPVRTTPLQEWIERSAPGTFHARRLKRPVDDAGLARAREWASRQAGKDYDLRFAWNDRELYCSELVWKLYKAAGVELCKPRPFREYNLEAPSVQAIIEKRYGGMDKLPLDEPAVAPGDLATSKLLVEAPRREPRKKG